MIEFLIIASIAGAIAGGAGSIMITTYREKRREYAALEAAERLERKLPGEAAIAPPAPPSPAPFFQQRQEAPIIQPPAIAPREALWQQLAEYEGGWILDVLERPILIWGAQGSYKSYFAAYLALLRILLKGHQVEVNDPHILLNRDKAWKALLACGVPAYGSRVTGNKEEGFNYLAIAQRIDAFSARLRTATDAKQWHSPIFDEMSQYAFEPDIKDVAGTLMLKCLSDCRKGKEAPILLAHNNTQALTGGGTGTHQAKEEGLAQLHLYSTSRNGEYYPLFKGELTGLPNERGKLVSREVTIQPDWMNAEVLLAQFPELRQANTSPAPATMASQIELNEERAKLAHIFNLPAETPQHEQDLPPHLQVIWEYLQSQNGSVSVRQIQQNLGKRLKGIAGEASAEKIREFCQELAAVKPCRLNEDTLVLLAVGDG